MVSCALYLCVDVSVCTEQVCLDETDVAVAHLFSFVMHMAKNLTIDGANDQFRTLRSVLLAKTERPSTCLDAVSQVQASIASSHYRALPNLTNVIF